jgi:protein-tyrosine-phosphatase
MRDVKRILIVCTGNSCRSIMAEAYLVKRLKETGLADIHVISAGTSAMTGLSPTDEAIEVMKASGIDVSGYVSSPLTLDDITHADIILAMEPYHREKVLNLAPDAEERIRLLREFAPKKNWQGLSITDPIGRPIEVYRKVFAIIEESIEGFLRWLRG